MGAVDGIAIEITKPRGVNDFAQHWSRRGYYALPVQALVDRYFRFMFVSVKCVGSTHDSLAIRATKLSNELLERALQFPYHLVGDDACASSNFLMVSINNSKATLGSPTDTFNLYQSSLRMHAEQESGQLLARWRLLGSRMSYSLKVTVKLIPSAMAVQKFTKDKDHSQYPKFITGLERGEARNIAEEWIAKIPGETQQGPWRDLERDTFRNTTVNNIEKQGLVRPLM